MEIFTLRPGEEYIEMNQLLKVTTLVQSGGHAKIVIEDGLVTVNGEQEFRKRRKMRDGDILELEGQKVEVKAA